ncbi:MAG: T9SS type A sorting domain-containing protein, partial [Fibrobacteria bacterium]|nr:T9SS type A sorting domain-containing protein [Fibrobacteria bacterium]
MYHIWKKLSVSIIFLGFSLLFAGLPTDKMMMLALETPPNYMLVNSKRATSQTVLSFEELTEIGVNGLLTGRKTARAYTMWEWVNEAHEYGFWVAGGPALHMGWDFAMEEMGGMAAAGYDFAEADEPFYWHTCKTHDHVIDFGESEYKQLKNAGQIVNPGFKFVVTDVNCNHNIENWGSLNGLFSEVYIDAWYQKYIPQMVSYNSRHPNQFNGVWVYLLAMSDSFERWNTDAQFDLWLTDAYNKLDNVILFLFTHRGNGVEGVSNGTDWAARSQIIKKVTGGGKPLPLWQNFTQSSQVTGAPDFSVQVRSSKWGVLPETVECYYSVADNKYGNTKWIKHDKVSFDSPDGNAGWVTVKAERVPFNTTGTGAALAGPRVRFKIIDNYPGYYLRGPRKVKKDFPVTIKEVGWSGFSGVVPVRSLHPDFTINIQNSGGIDISTAVCEYSIDNGITWKTHPATCSGSAGSTGKESLSVKAVPFVEDKGKVNKIRFGINTSGGKAVKSAEYPVKIEIPPRFSNLKLTRSGDAVDVTLSLQDADGIRVGLQKPSVREETIAQYSFDGDGTDLSGNGYDAVNKNGTTYSTTDSWKKVPGKEQSVCFDGSGDFTEMGQVFLSPTEALTISGWVKAENNNYFLAIGGKEERGTINMRVNDKNQLQLYHRDVTDRSVFSIISPEGSMKLNEWRHVAFTYDGHGTGKLYIDGNVAGSLVLESGSNTKFKSFHFSPLRLGMPSDNAIFFKGCVDELQVTGRALSEAEVASDYYSGMYRYTTDGGKTWSKWEKSTLSAIDGNTAPVSVSVNGLPLPARLPKSSYGGQAGADSMNRIEFTARDIYGNTAIQQYTLLGNDAVPVMQNIVDMGKLNFAPNPFYDVTALTFSLVVPQKVEIDVFGINGKQIRTLTSRFYASGKHSITWNGKGEQERVLSAGQYFVRIKIGENMLVKKIMKL